MRNPLIATRVRLQDAAESLSVAYWIMSERSAGDYHLRSAGKSLMRALAGSESEHNHEREGLRELIREAIENVHDMDVTFDDYAEGVIDALMESAIPGYAKAAEADRGREAAA
ncbi:hypothetical protein P6F26_16675 [Roseibacterium sp. SDUM158017]|uniref:hypothetical protein n=1 Tax=Roseicyclus salinarum TaxID=3036773 RepID=UPI002414F214|nr:hypothetical protein [Roseibacterium sp. SDUM158017]MDG4650084.1 hypothetical protein [Roseibacterium sp. SDUM158017]